MSKILAKRHIDKGGPNVAKKMISLEISDELREALRVEAFNRSLNMSALIRVLLKEALSRPKDEGKIVNEQDT